MDDGPSATALLVEAAHALRAGLKPGFEQRVAAHAIDLALREQALGGAMQARQAERLGDLLGQHAQTDALCAAIRSGRLALDDAALIAHLHATAAETLAIDNPAYPAFAQRKGR